VNLELFDLEGRRVQTLIRSDVAPGSHAATWNGLDRHGNHVRNGVYFVRLTTPSKLFHTRLVRLN
jgi:flagellar hook assembly protein FlgD